MKINRVIKMYHEILDTKAGGSFPLERQDKRTTGFFVSVTDNPVLLEDVAETLEKVINLLEELNCSPERKYVGVWKPDRDVIYVDASIWCPHLPDALALGKLFMQVSIWDIKAQKEIRLNK